MLRYVYLVGLLQKLEGFNAPLTKYIDINIKYYMTFTKYIDTKQYIICI